jgi:hypothetical protein
MQFAVYLHYTIILLIYIGQQWFEFYILFKNLIVKKQLLIYIYIRAVPVFNIE